MNAAAAVGRGVYTLFSMLFTAAMEWLCRDVPAATARALQVPA